MLFSSEKIKVIFDKECYIYGIDLVISWYIEWCEEESIDIFVETRCGIKKDNSDFSSIPDHYQSVKSDHIIISKISWYCFTIPLEFPNINSWMGIYDSDLSYVGNFLRVKNTYTSLPVIVKQLDEYRKISQKNIEEIEKWQSRESERYQLSAFSNVTEFFKKRVLNDNWDFWVVRLPWNLRDTVNAEYYYSIVHSSFLCSIAHAAYLYNIHFYIYLWSILYVIFSLPYVLSYLDKEINSLNTYFLLVGFIVFTSAIVITIFQKIFKKKVYPSKFFLKQKNDTVLDGIFDKNTITFSDILEESTYEYTNILTRAWGKVRFCMHTYYHFTYQTTWKNSMQIHHLDNILFKRILEQRFTSHAELLAITINFWENIFLKERKILEKIGVFTWLSLFVEYDQFPDKVYEYNTNRFISEK